MTTATSSRKPSQSGKTAKAAKTKSTQATTPDTEALADASLETLSDEASLTESDPLSTQEPDKSPVTALVSTHQLTRAMEMLKEVGSGKPIQPVLANVLIQANPDERELMLTATGTTLTTRTVIPATVSSRWETTAPLALLHGAARELPTQECELYLVRELVPNRSKQKSKEIEAHTIHILADGKTVYEFKGVPASEFPAVHGVEGKSLITLELPPRAFKAGLEAVLFAAGKNPNMAIIQGVHLQLFEHQVIATATDGHRVAMAEISLQGIGRGRSQPTVDPLTRFTAPAKTIKELLRNLSKDDTDLILTYSPEDNRVSFAWSSGEDGDELREIISQCLAGAYPDCAQLLAQYDYPHSVTLARSALQQALNALAVLRSGKTENDIVEFDFDVKNATVSLTLEQQQGKALQQVPLESSTPTLDGFSIRFALGYLLSILKSIQATGITARLGAPNSPALLESSKDGAGNGIRSRYFVMPVAKVNPAQQTSESAKANGTAKRAQSKPEKA
ncbi:MAG: DNA polymerase III subunit beta [Leptolyngbyaceae cyanobacterium MO_188.B28]|nr:DNA polymerase III subunit beta [Leptolyngbyaceae cyanobacterium MO_188.B28]